MGDMADLCRMADCERPVMSRGLCSACYQRMKYQGLLDEVSPNPSKMCAYCDRPVPAGRRWGAKFCSFECKEADHTRQIHEKIVAAHRAKARKCDWCTTPLDPERPDGTRFCSSKCGDDWSNHQRSVDTKRAVAAARPPCAVCGGVVPPGRNRASIYCSADCKSKSRRGTHPAKVRVRKGENLKRVHAMTLADYEGMLAAQDQRCAICGTDRPGGISDSLHVDHCHATGAIRGLLCINCNNGLGNYRDNPALLRAAADYLERHAMT